MFGRCVSVVDLTMDDFKDSKDDKLRMHELKQRAKAYYATGDGDGVLTKMEEILNAMFYDKPEDVFGHLVREPLYWFLCSCLSALFSLAENCAQYVHF